MPENIAGLTTAVANMIIMSFGYIFHSVIGAIIKSYNTTGEDLAMTYGIAFIPATLLVGVIGFLILIYQEQKNYKN